jgi:hypothetical protein
VAALTFSLVEEALSLSQPIPPVVIGFILGGVSYSVTNRILDKKSSGHGNSPANSNTSGTVIIVQSEKERDPMEIMQETI